MGDLEQILISEKHDFYNSLRAIDREKTKTIVDSLVRIGFEVYAVGSATKQDRQYHDIDLLLVPKDQGMFIKPSELALCTNQAEIRTLIEKYLGRQNRRFIEALGFAELSLQGEPIRSRLIKDKVHAYVGSLVRERFGISIGETTSPLDISLASTEPFTIYPDEKRILLGSPSYPCLKD